MASLRWLAMALMVVAVVPPMKGFGPGVATAEDHHYFTYYLLTDTSMPSGWMVGCFYPGGYVLHLQQDCNMVLYPFASPQDVLWSSNTAGSAQQCILDMQADCNAVLYEFGAQIPLWASQTAGKGTDCFLEVQNNADVAIYDGNGNNLWNTNTVHP